MSKYVYSLDPERPNNTGAAIYQTARSGGPTVLDIGSGPGIIGSYLAKHAGKTVTCLDYDVEALISAGQQGVDHTHVVDLREPSWYAPVLGNSYDVVILADVLEHLVDPERVLGDLRRERLVKDDGHLVVSVPNANHQSVIVELLTGHFDYTETGLLDRTHLRFFTLDSIQSLLEACAFMITRVHRTTMPFESTRQACRAPEVSPTLRAAIDELGLESRTFQYVLEVRPTTEPARILDLGRQLKEAKAEIHSAQTATQRAIGQVEEAQASAAVARQTAATANAATDALRAQLDEMEQELDKMEQELTKMRASTSWTIGRSVVRLGTPLRALRRG